MAFNQEDDPNPAAEPSDRLGEGAAPGSVYNPIYYSYLYTDADGKRVFQGTDGQLYTEAFGEDVPNGFAYVPYSGPGDRAGQPPPAAEPSPAPEPTPAPPQPTGGGGGGGGGGGAAALPPGYSLGDLIKKWDVPFTPPAPQQGPPSWLPAAPSFTPPAFQKPPEFTPPEQFTAPAAFQAPAAFELPTFTAPTAESIQADPSYQARLAEGQRALEQSAAGRGILRTGGTLSDVLKYGQQFASNEYGNIYDRAAHQYATDVANKLNAYQTNYQTALGSYNTNYQNAMDAYKTKYQNALNTYQTNYQGALDAYNAQYKSAQDVFAPLMTEYQTKAQAAQRQGELDYQRAYQQWLDSYNMFRQGQNDAWQKLYAYAST